MISQHFLSFLLPCLVKSLKTDGIKSYKAKIQPFPSADDKVAGDVVVFSLMDETTIAYGVFVTGLEAGIVASLCNETNGCGVHIHEGSSCDSPEEALGHYFADTIAVDPWIDERYSTDEVGNTVFSSILSIGTNDLMGKAFVAHREDGSRLGCGLLEKVDEFLVAAETMNLVSGSSANSDVAVIPIPGTDQLCFAGYATGLDPNVVSFRNVEGDQCSNTNGCGVHIHSGTSCSNTDAQGGHYYNQDTVGDDPWLEAIYDQTASQLATRATPTKSVPSLYMQRMAADYLVESLRVATH